jgi:hypothetical protein
MLLTQSPATAPCAEVGWLYVDCFVVIRSIRVDTIRLSELVNCYTGG